MQQKIDGLLVPKLRFPEFWDAGEWEEKPLSRVGEIITGNTPSTANLDNYGGNRLFVSPADMSYERYIATTKTTLSEQGFQETRPIKANSILFVCIGSTIGKIAQNKILCATNQQINSIVPFIEYSNEFIYSALENSASKITLLAGNHAVPIINKTLFSSVLVGFPSLPEQKKIADCLSSISDRITLEAQKLDTLKAHKKGLMQQLFPAEGETLPKLRFPEFQDSGEWEEKLLSEVTTSIFDGTHQTPKYKDKGIPFFSVENIVSGKTNKFISKEDYLIATNKNKPEKGDILITRIGNIGFSTVVNWDYEFSIYVTLAVVKSNKKFNAYYLHSFMQSDRYQKEIQSKSLLNAVPCKINMDELRKTKVLLPSSLEQQKIADCLSSLDELIAAQTQAIDTLKTHKKGLMQQLFPSVEEVKA